MATWPANGDTNWNTAMLAYLAVGHNTDGVNRGFIQQVVTPTGVVSTGTTVIPFDDTSPTNSEGDLILTTNITPKATDSVIHVESIVNVSCSSSSAGVILSIFRDGANIGNVFNLTGLANHPFQLVISVKDEPTTTSQVAYTARVGPESAATVTVNGVSGARKFGGLYYTHLTCTEYQP